MVHRNCNQRVVHHHCTHYIWRPSSGRKCCCDTVMVIVSPRLTPLVLGPGWYWDDWQFPVSSRHIDISTGLSCLTIYTISGYPATNNHWGQSIILRFVLLWHSIVGKINYHPISTRGDVEILFSFILPQSLLNHSTREWLHWKNLAWIIPMKIIIRYNAFSHYTNILSDPISTYSSL